MTIDLTSGLPVEREYVLAEAPSERDIRDAVNVWIETDDAEFGMRIGVEAVSQQWAAHDIWLDIAFANGRLLSRRGTGKTHSAIGPEGLPTIRGAGPLKFQCVEPFRKWTVSFDGPVAEITAKQLIDNPALDERVFSNVHFEITMDMAVPPWIPGSMLPDAQAILSSSDQGKFVSPRYEQLFRCRGSLQIGEQQRNFTGQGLRIRRQGYRKFEGFWGHCWQSALFPSGKAFGLNIFPPRQGGAANYAEGYIFSGDGLLKPARPVEVPWMRRLVTHGDPVPLALQTDEGLVRIDGVTFANTRSRSHADVPANFPIVQQAHARYSWGAETATGMVERSTLPAEMSL